MKDTQAKPAATSATVTLDEPIKREGGDIATLILRKPSSGELRGLSLVDLVQMEVNALHKLLPRITQPSITEQEAHKLAPSDLVQCGMEVAVFLTPKSVQGDSLSA